MYYLKGPSFTEDCRAHIVPLERSGQKEPEWYDNIQLCKLCQVATTDDGSTEQTISFL